MITVPVSLGSSRLLASGKLKGRKVGIVSNPASVDANYVHVVDAMMTPDMLIRSGTGVGEEIRAWMPGGKLYTYGMGLLRSLARDPALLPEE